MSRDRLFTVAACAVVAAGLVFAFIVIGTPGHARAIALDARRVHDLQYMAARIHERYHGFANLPARLPADIVADDPQTHRAYRFVRSGSKQYQLCATFSERSPKQDIDAAGILDSRARSWAHPAGTKCYRLEYDSPAYDIPD